MALDEAATGALKEFSLSPEPTQPQQQRVIRLVAGDGSSAVDLPEAAARLSPVLDAALRGEPPGGEAVTLPLPFVRNGKTLGVVAEFLKHLLAHPADAARAKDLALGLWSWQAPKNADDAWYQRLLDRPGDTGFHPRENGDADVLEAADALALPLLVDLASQRIRRVVETDTQWSFNESPQDSATRNRCLAMRQAFGIHSTQDWDRWRREPGQVKRAQETGQWQELRRCMTRYGCANEYSCHPRWTGSPGQLSAARVPNRYNQQHLSEVVGALPSPLQSWELDSWADKGNRWALRTICSDQTRPWADKWWRCLFAPTSADQRQKTLAEAPKWLPALLGILGPLRLRPADAHRYGLANGTTLELQILTAPHGADRSVLAAVVSKTIPPGSPRGVYSWRDAATGAITGDLTAEQVVERLQAFLAEAQQSRPGEALYARVVGRLDRPMERGEQVPTPFPVMTFEVRRLSPQEVARIEAEFPVRLGDKARSEGATLVLPLEDADPNVEAFIKKARLTAPPEYWVATRDAPLNAAAAEDRTLVDDSATPELYRSILEDRPEQLEDAEDAELQLSELEDELRRRRQHLDVDPVRAAEEWQASVRELEAAVDARSRDEAAAQKLKEDLSRRPDLPDYEELKRRLGGVDRRALAERRSWTRPGEAPATTMLRQYDEAQKPLAEFREFWSRAAPEAWSVFSRLGDAPGLARAVQDQERLSHAAEEEARRAVFLRQREQDLGGRYREAQRSNGAAELERLQQDFTRGQAALNASPGNRWLALKRQADLQREEVYEHQRRLAALQRG